MQIGIFGGTFDPVHIGHLIIAEQAREQAQLHEIWFVPSARPPHKLDQPVSHFERRAEMLQLAVAGQLRFHVKLFEKDRPGPSFTADTLVELHRERPGDEFYLILGADCLPYLAKWHEPATIIDRATLLIAGRPGWDLWKAAQLAESLQIEDASRVRLRALELPLIEISSSDLRKRAAQKRSLLFMVPHAVEVYIREKKMYDE